MKAESPWSKSSTSEPQPPSHSLPWSGPGAELTEHHWKSLIWSKPSPFRWGNQDRIGVMAVIPIFGFLNMKGGGLNSFKTHLKKKMQRRNFSKFSQSSSFLKGSFEADFKAASPWEAEMNNYQQVCRVYREDYGRKSHILHISGHWTM